MVSRSAELYGHGGVLGVSLAARIGFGLASAQGRSTPNRHNTSPVVSGAWAVGASMDCPAFGATVLGFAPIPVCVARPVPSLSGALRWQLAAFAWHLFRLLPHPTPSLPLSLATAGTLSCASASVQSFAWRQTLSPRS